MVSWKIASMYEDDALGLPDTVFWGGLGGLM